MKNAADDNRPCNEEYLIDYRDFPPTACESVRITLFDVQKAPFPGLVDFTAFGDRNETV